MKKYANELGGNSIMYSKVIIKNNVVNENCSKYIFNAINKNDGDNIIIRALNNIRDT